MHQVDERTTVADLATLTDDLPQDSRPVLRLRDPHRRDRGFLPSVISGTSRGSIRPGTQPHRMVAQRERRGTAPLVPRLLRHLPLGNDCLACVGGVVLAPAGFAHSLPVACRPVFLRFARQCDLTLFLRFRRRRPHRRKVARRRTVRQGAGRLLFSRLGLLLGFPVAGGEQARSRAQGRRFACTNSVWALTAAVRGSACPVAPSSAVRSGLAAGLIGG